MVISSLDIETFDTTSRDVLEFPNIKHWAKVVDSVDMEQCNGYGINGDWFKLYGRQTLIEDGKLVVAVSRYEMLPLVPDNPAAALSVARRTVNQRFPHNENVIILCRADANFRFNVECEYRRDLGVACGFIGEGLELLATSWQLPANSGDIVKQDPKLKKAVGKPWFSIFAKLSELQRLQTTVIEEEQPSRRILMDTNPTRENQ